MRRTPAADGLLHRHLGLHRLQGVRGGVQGVERRPRGRARRSPGCPYDNTGGLGADTWRHVAFIEQRRPLGAPGRRAGTADSRRAAMAADGFRWLMASDVCKHCTHAACLDVCPTGALFRTEFGTVVVQEDICNGCGYCVPACPYGVIDQRKDDGRAWKCTLCYDRLGDGQEPACAKACPTESIQFGPLDELRERADAPGRAAARGGRRRGPAVRRATRTTASAATARSSCCSTSRRCTACRRTRSSPPATCPRMWRHAGWPRSRWSAARSRRLLGRGRR